MAPGWEFQCPDCGGNGQFGECPSCRGLGVRPAARGQALLDFVRRHLSARTGRGALRQDSMPHDPEGG